MYNEIREKILKSEFYDIYTVKEGDTLYNISKDFKVNLKLLSELNGKDMDTYIYPNEVLLIPKKGVRYYITKEDDTLKEVAKIFKVKENDLVNQNKSLYLLSGQMIFYKDY